MEATPEDHPDKAARLNSFGAFLGRRYQQTGNLQDLEAAIMHAEAAVDGTPEDQQTEQDG